MWLRLLSTGLTANLCKAGWAYHCIRSSFSEAIFKDMHHKIKSAIKIEDHRADFYSRRRSKTRLSTGLYSVQLLKTGFQFDTYDFIRLSNKMELN